MSSERLEGGNIKGGMLQAHFDWAREKLGADALDRIRAKLQPADAELIARPLLATRMYPFRLLIMVDRAIAALLGGREADVFRELGRNSANRNLSTVYQVFNSTQPHEFFERAARLHSRFQDFGHASYEKTGPTTCRLSLHEYTCYSKVFCLSALGYYEESTRLQGAKNAKVVETTCTCDGSDACRFDISWELTLPGGATARLQ